MPKHKAIERQAILIHRYRIALDQTQNPKDAIIEACSYLYSCDYLQKLLYRINANKDYKTMIDAKIKEYETQRHHDSSPRSDL